ncbi:MAG: endolytic transglycosylase MltG [Bryobacteraceae bacterium]
MIRVFAVAALLVLAGCGAVGWLLWAPYGGDRGPTRIELTRGARSRAIAEELARAGVVRHPWIFLAARALRKGAVLQAGEYLFEKPATPLEVLDRLVRGDVIFYELAIPEGQNLFEIAQAAGRLPFLRADPFLAAARDPALIRDLDPQAPTLEGYLFPDTYRITRQTTELDLCRQMVRRFRQVWAELKPTADAHQIVTLASLVEKEAAVGGERPQVAGVFRNRLRLGMKLDCDPTTIYAALLENRWTGVIHRSDLDNPHPYNTYRNPGLPPGPITNPGRASLRAAIDPAVTDSLYFVAMPDGSGRHWFSKDLAAHETAVRKYRSGQAKVAQTRTDQSPRLSSHP